MRSCFTQRIEHFGRKGRSQCGEGPEMLTFLPNEAPVRALPGSIERDGVTYCLRTLKRATSLRVGDIVPLRDSTSRELGGRLGFAPVVDIWSDRMIFGTPCRRVRLGKWTGDLYGFQTTELMTFPSREDVVCYRAKGARS